MKIIGLTGGIASGKSTVARALRNQGAVIINADKIGHEVIEPGKPAWKEIVSFFGSRVLNKDQQINRVELGKIVFDNLEYLKKLNSITHPRIIEAFKEALRTIRRRDPGAVIVMEIPLLFEVNMQEFCDEIWVVWVDRETQINRLMKRDGLTRDHAIKRIDAQMSLDEKARRADIIIDNTKSIEETVNTTTRFFKEIFTNT
jgi:dephospho-CoA kinase